MQPSLYSHRSIQVLVFRQTGNMPELHPVPVMQDLSWASDSTELLIAECLIPKIREAREAGLFAVKVRFCHIFPCIVLV